MTESRQPDQAETEDATRAFHWRSEELMAELGADYSLRIGQIAEKLAKGDNSAEVQPGHIERARIALEESSAKRAKTKAVLRMIGAALFGVGANGVVSNSSQTVADAFPLIIVGVLGILIAIVELPFEP